MRKESRRIPHQVHQAHACVSVVDATSDVSASLLRIIEHACLDESPTKACRVRDQPANHQGSLGAAHCDACPRGEHMGRLQFEPGSSHIPNVFGRRLVEPYLMNGASGFHKTGQGHGWAVVCLRALQRAACQRLIDAPIADHFESERTSPPGTGL